MSATWPTAVAQALNQLRGVGRQPGRLAALGAVLGGIRALPDPVSGAARALEPFGIEVLRNAPGPVLVLDVQEREAWLDGHKIASFGRSRTLWSLFVQIAEPAEPPGRPELFGRVWKEPYRPPSSDDKLHMAVVRVRKRLGDAPIQLEPLTAGGYWLRGVGAVARFDRMAVAEEPQTPALSPPLRRLLGRDREVALATAALSHGRVCVTGPPGAGKSHVAWAVASPFPAAWRVDLASCSDLDDALGAIGIALDLPLCGDPVGQVAAFLAGRGQAVLWLDHIDPVREVMIPVLDRWRREAPEVAVLATGDRPLPEAHTINLTGLSSEAAVAMYIDRAGERSAGWQPDDEERARIEELVDVLGGLPLAIALAAARSPVLSAGGVLAHLRTTGLRVLARPAEEGRHSSLHNTVAWALSRLDEVQRDVLGQCAVFRDGFTVETAQAVLDLSSHAGAPWLVDVLDTLCACNLVGAMPGPHVGRLHIVRTVDQIAWETLSADAQIALRARHAAHFAMAYGSEEALRTLRDGGRVALRSTAVADRANLLLAAQSTDPGHAAAAGLAAMTIAMRAGPFSQTIRLGEQLLGRGDLGDADVVRVALRSSSAYRQSGDLDRAGRALDRAEAAATTEESRARVLVFRADLLRVCDQQDEAERLIEASNALFPSGLGDPLGRLRRLVWALLRRYSEPDVACAALTELAPILRRVGDVRSETLVLLSLGAIHHERRRFLAARQALGQALDVGREAEDQRLTSLILTSLGAAEGSLQNAEGARRHLEAALELHHRLGARRSEGITAGNLAEILLRTGRPTEAMPLLQRAVHLLRAVGDAATTCQFLAALGEARVRLGDVDGGWRDLDAALHGLDETHMIRVEVYGRRARLARTPAEADREARAAEELSVKLGFTSPGP